METYNEFMARISSFQHQQLNLGNGYFTANSSVSDKAENDGRFKSFYGDTVVFNLDSKTKKSLALLVDFLYENAGECLCQRLEPHTMHMTLHDLSSSPDLDKVARELFVNELNIFSLKNKFSKTKIRMKSKFIFNMVGTSIVAGLYPADENEYEKLMELYYAVDSFRPLPYPFTPHITLAYFLPAGFTREKAERLEKAVTELNKKSFQFTLYTENLFYQKFTDMNSYFNIINLD